MIYKNCFRQLVLAAALAGPPHVLFAQDLVYTPVNPSFGGSPLNSSHLMGLASAQRTATAEEAKEDTAGGGAGGDDTDTDVDLFIRQLQGRLLSALASQVTEAIFGENPQDNGTIIFGDTTVTFERTVDSIVLTITDPTGTTVIEVPQLLTTDTAEALSATPAALAQRNNALGMGSLGGGALAPKGDLTVKLGSGLN